MRGILNMRRKVYAVLLALLEAIIYYYIFVALDINLGILRQSLGLYLIYMLMCGHYSIKDTLIWNEIKHVTKATAFYLITYIIILPTSMFQDKRRYLVFLAIIMYFITIFLSRTLRIVFRKFLVRNTLVIGTGKDALDYGRTLNNNRFAITRVVGFVDMNTCSKFDQQFNNVVDSEKSHKFFKYDVFKYQDLRKIVKDKHIEQISIVEPDMDQKAFDIAMEDASQLVDHVKYMPEDNHMMNFSSSIRDFDGILIISASRRKPRAIDAVLKRMMDIFFSLIGCLFILPIAVVVKIMNLAHGDHAPIFYKQKRVGRYGRDLNVYKFRSMVPNAEEVLKDILARDPEKKAEWERSAKLEDDPRVTAAGKFLRKTSLDEFPQFINVLKGDMSLIGPRPVIPEELECYGDRVTEFLSAKPGLTGYWASHGRSDVDYPERCDLELYYVHHQSIFLDLQIVLRTALGVIFGEGAR